MVELQNRKPVKYTCFLSIWCSVCVDMIRFLSEESTRCYSQQLPILLVRWKCSIPWPHQRIWTEMVFIAFLCLLLLSLLLCMPFVKPSVLWCCWLGGRKGIRPVKTSGGVLAWLSAWSKVQTGIWPSWCHCHSLSLDSVKSRFVLPFWYRLTWIVPEKRPLNGCVCVLLLSCSCCWQSVTNESVC